MAQPFSLDFAPGVERDGTTFDSKAYAELVWSRFRLGRPRKIGGYKTITAGLNGIARRIHSYYNSGKVISHVGTTAGIQQVVYDSSGNLISIADRTPPTYAGGVDVGWTIDALFDTTSSVVQLVCHAVPDNRQLASAIQTPAFLGQIDATTPLGAFTAPGALFGGSYIPPTPTGGVFCVQPFVFCFGTDGNLQWSGPNLALTLGVTGGTSGAGQARISAQKIMAGMALRGGGSQSPAAVIWTLGEVITATYVGTPAWFAFNTVSDQSSILSSACVIEYDGLYFWSGVDRFMVFNGTVSELPNNQNQDFFFDNLTPGYETLTFATKVPRYGEIWWCACMFGSTVPNWAIIFNLRENCWYDTPLPNGGRGAAYFAQGIKYPIFAGVQATSTGYKLWLHEFGMDEVTGASSTPILSSFTTGFFGGPKNNPPDNRGLSIHQLEPDFEQSGDLTVSLLGTPNARTATVTAGTSSIPLVASTPQEALASFTPTTSLRLAQLKVLSNVLGGNYIAGRNLLQGEPADGRRAS